MNKAREGFLYGRLRAKLSFDDGFAERPLYNIKAFTNEKEKGIDMVELIGNNFGISRKDIDEALQRKLKEWNEDAMKPTIIKDEEIKKKQIKFTRDERGNIVSPFKSKKKIV